MSYLEAVNQMVKQRRKCIGELAGRIEAMAARFMLVEHELFDYVSKFHQSQRTFKVTSWYQVEFVLPEATGTDVAFKGPFLSYCERAGQRVSKKRIVEMRQTEKVCCSGFVALRSEYSQLAIKLGSITKLLDLRSRRSPNQEAKRQKRQAFMDDRCKRLAELPSAIRGLADALDQLDAVADEAIFEFNAVEGKKKRYGSLLSRWEIPSRIPSYTLSGPRGPGVFFISYNRSYRMSSPIKVLYEKVHPGQPKGEVPLTRQMIQKSRLGKHYRKYRESYQEILSIRYQRNDLIRVLESIENYAR